MFDQKGVVRVGGSLDEEALLEAALEGGAESYEISEEEDGPVAEVFAEVTNLQNLSQTLQDSGFEVLESELRWIPNNTVEVTDFDQARSLLKLIDALEDLDDVQNVTPNFEMADEVMSLSIA